MTKILSYIFSTVKSVSVASAIYLYFYYGLYDVVMALGVANIFSILELICDYFIHKSEVNKLNKELIKSQWGNKEIMAGNGILLLEKNELKNNLLKSEKENKEYLSKFQSDGSYIAKLIDEKTSMQLEISKLKLSNECLEIDNRKLKEMSTSTGSKGFPLGEVKSVINKSKAKKKKSAIKA